MKYNDIRDLKIDISIGQVDASEISAYDNSGELYLYDEHSSLIYHGEYFSHQACQDICKLLGIEELNEE